MLRLNTVYLPSKKLAIHKSVDLKMQRNLMIQCDIIRSEQNAAKSKAGMLPRATEKNTPRKRQPLQGFKEKQQLARRKKCRRAVQAEEAAWGRPRSKDKPTGPGEGNGVGIQTCEAGFLRGGSWKPGCYADLDWQTIRSHLRQSSKGVGEIAILSKDSNTSRVGGGGSML